jgi:hypothetical protein
MPVRASAKPHQPIRLGLIPRNRPTGKRLSLQSLHALLAKM